jgi:hypothetical protein
MKDDRIGICNTQGENSKCEESVVPEVSNRKIILKWN